MAFCNAHIALLDITEPQDYFAAAKIPFHTQAVTDFTDYLN